MSGEEKVQPPFEMPYVDSKGYAVIEEEEVRLVEQKRLGQSTTKMAIADIVKVGRRSHDAGEFLTLRRRVGNPLRIGPLDSEVASAGVELLERMREE